MPETLTGAIIAAGRGERLRAAGAGLPKPLVELGGRTLLARQARALLDAGATTVLAVVNSETASLIAARKIALPPELDLEVRDTPNSMETLFALGERLRPGRFALATVDAILPRTEFRRFIARALELTAPGRDACHGALAVVRWRGDRRPLFAAVGASGLIEELGERESAFVTAGVYLFSTSIFRFADEARVARLSAMRQFLAHLLKRRMRLAAVEVSSAIDIDEGADLTAAAAMLAGDDERSAAAGRG